MINWAQGPTTKELVVEDTMVGTRDSIWVHASQACGNCVKGCKTKNWVVEECG